MTKATIIILFITMSVHYPAFSHFLCICTSFFMHFGHWGDFLTTNMALFGEDGGVNDWNLAVQMDFGASTPSPLPPALELLLPQLLLLRPSSVSVRHLAVFG